MAVCACCRTWGENGSRRPSPLPVTCGTEAMLDHFGVAETNWRDVAKQDEHFIASETPFYVGRAVACLAGDPNVGAKARKAFMSGDLAEEYGFRDAGGSQPNWSRYFAEHFPDDA